MLTCLYNPWLVAVGCLLYLIFFPEYLVFFKDPSYMEILHPIIMYFRKFRKFHQKEFHELLACIQFHNRNPRRITQLLKKCFHDGSVLYLDGYTGSYLLFLYSKFRNITFIRTGIRQYLYQIAVSQITRNKPVYRVYYESEPNCKKNQKKDPPQYGFLTWSAVLVRPKNSSGQKQSPAENEDCGVVGKETLHRCPEKHQNCSDQDKSMIPVLYMKANSGKLYTHKDSPLSCLYYEYTTPNSNVNSSPEVSK